MGALVILSLLIRNPKLKISGVICTAPTLGFPLNRNIGPFKEFVIKNFGHYLEVFLFLIILKGLSYKYKYKSY